MSAVNFNPFGATSRREGKVLVISLDYDNCFEIVSNSPSAVDQRKTTELAAKAARDLRAYMDSVSEGYYRVIIQNGSMRQDHDTDAHNEKINLAAYLVRMNLLDGQSAFRTAQEFTLGLNTDLRSDFLPGVTGRCIEEFPAFVEAEKRRRDVDHSSWEFSQFSAVDGLKRWSPGDTYLKKGPIRRAPMRKDKVDMLGYQMRYFKERFRAQDVDFLFVDDYPRGMVEGQRRELPAEVPEGLYFASVKYDSFGISYEGLKFTGRPVLSVDRTVTAACGFERAAMLARRRRKKTVDATPFATAAHGFGGPTPSVAPARDGAQSPSSMTAGGSEGEEGVMGSTPATALLPKAGHKKDGNRCCVIC